MEHMLRAWKIDKKKVHVIQRDNAANMKKAMEQLGVPSLGCFAHTLQLVVQHGLLAQRAVSDAIANGRRIVTHFKHSPKAYAELEDVEEELNVEPKRLQQDVKTRWSSTKMMIDSLVHCKRALQAYVSDSDSNLPVTLTGNQWSLLEKTATVLKPFQELTAQVSAASATAADVIPFVRVLTRFLDSESEEHRGIQTMKATLLDAVHTRFDHVETEPLYAVATMLDPRYKDKFLTATNLDQAKEALKVEVMKMEQELKTMPSGEGVAEAETARQTPEMEAGSSTSSLGSYFDEILEESGTAGPSEQQITPGALFQLESYLSEPPLGRKHNPFQYWRDNQARLPTLAATAAKFLSAPCTSVESERLFSAVSLIIDEHRSRLTPEHLEMLVFVKKNLPIMLGLQPGHTVEGSV
ncbi:zinc finger BED domain-containing protein 4-like [Eleginops maclovinus]|uniref:zinc finger BED domain-containing protein 4-like n=1 Tax=Eleginops maclovinus TaxID=56733 RepID=UPI003080A52E